MKHCFLDELNFSNTSISDQELAYLSGLSLSILILNNCKITDQGLEFLKVFAQLKELNLNGCDNITDQGLEYLKDFTQLRKLDLSVVIK